jgi:hypothetical protein
VAVTRSPSTSVSRRTLLSTGRVERGETALDTRLNEALSAEGETVHLMAERVPIPVGQLFTGGDSLGGDSVEIRGD